MAATVVEKAFCVLELAKTNSVTLVPRLFRRRYGKPPPARQSIYDWSMKFQETGRLCNLIIYNLKFNEISSFKRDLVEFKLKFDEISLNFKRRDLVEFQIVFYDLYCIVSPPYIPCDMRMVQHKGRNMSSA